MKKRHHCFPMNFALLKLNNSIFHFSLFSLTYKHVYIYTRQKKKIVDSRKNYYIDVQLENLPSLKTHDLPTRRCCHRTLILKSNIRNKRNRIENICCYCCYYDETVSVTRSQQDMFKSTARTINSSASCK